MENEILVIKGKLEAKYSPVNTGNGIRQKIKFLPIGKNEHLIFTAYQQSVELLTDLEPGTLIQIEYVAGINTNNLWISGITPLDVDLSPIIIPVLPFEELVINLLDYFRKRFNLLTGFDEKIMSFVINTKQRSLDPIIVRFLLEKYLLKCQRNQDNEHRLKRLAFTKNPYNQMK